MLREKVDWREKLYDYLLCLEPGEFVGIARLLNVELVTYDDNDKPTPREAMDLMLDVFNKVEQMSKARRRNFMSLVKKAVGKSGKSCSRAVYVNNSDNVVEDVAEDVQCASTMEDCNGTNTENN